MLLICFVQAQRALVSAVCGLYAHMGSVCGHHFCTRIAIDRAPYAHHTLRLVHGTPACCSGVRYLQENACYMLGTDFKAGQTKFKTAAVEYIRSLGMCPKVSPLPDVLAVIPTQIADLVISRRAG